MEKTTIQEYYQEMMEVIEKEFDINSVPEKHDLAFLKQKEGFVRSAFYELNKSYNLFMKKLGEYPFPSQYTDAAYAFASLFSATVKNKTDDFYFFNKDENMDHFLNQVYFDLFKLQFAYKKVIAPDSPILELHNFANNHVSNVIAILKKNNTGL